MLVINGVDAGCKAEGCNHGIHIREARNAKGRVEMVTHADRERRSYKEAGGP